MSALGKGLGSLIPNKKQRPSIMSLDIDESIGDKKIPFDLLKLGKKIFKEHESLHDFDLWALHMLNDTIDESAKCFERFNLGE